VVLERGVEMMIETNEAQILNEVCSAQVLRNLNNTYLIEKATKMPYCKRNILLTKIALWDKVYADIIDLLIRGGESHRAWNINRDCLNYIKDKNLSNASFAEFFFNFHEPLTLAFLRRLLRELNNGMPYIEKFHFVAKEMTELLNIARIELDGLNISCESFGGEPMCPSYDACGVPDCTDVDNVFFVMMNEEYAMEEGLFERILEIALEYLKRAKNKVIMIVDYKNMLKSSYEFGRKARARYDLCNAVVEQIYFYNTETILFASKNSDLVPYIIPDKKGLNNVINTWREKKELVTF